MLKKIAEFSKVIAKYSYYPIFIGLISVISAIVNRGKPLAVLAWALFVVCGALSVFSFLSSWLCRKAGISDKII